MQRDLFFRNQRGISLIELMVGLAIGLIVILAAVASLAIVRASSRTMNDSAALEQQASLAMLQIGAQVSQAGAINAFAEGTSPDANIGGLTVASFTPATDSPLIRFDTRPAGVSADNPTLPVFGQDGADSDILQISYAKPNDGSPAGNCVSRPTSPLDGGAPRSVSVFSVDPSTRSLLCSPDPDSAAQGAPLPIAANVVEMRVGYLTADAHGAITGHANAQAVDAAGWSAVTAVQVCLELAGDPTQAGPQTFRKDCRGQEKTVNDGRLHRIVRNTFYLRNSRS